MDSDDDQVLYQIWKTLDTRLTNLYEKEVYKFLPLLDKTVRDRIGWRKMYPENEFERFEKFMCLVEEVYLTPSLQWNDSGSSDSVDIHGSE